MQHTKNFFSIKIETFIEKKFDFCNTFAQNIHCGYTGNVCFGSKIRKLGIPFALLHTQFFYIKVGFKGVYMSQTCIPDVVIAATKERSKLMSHSSINDCHCYTYDKIHTSL